MSFQSMFICCNMCAESTVRVVHSLSSSSSIWLAKKYTCISWFSILTQPTLVTVTEKLTMFGCIEQEVDPFSSHQERISSFSLGRTQDPLQSTVAQQRHAKTIQTKSVLLEKTRSEWKDHSPTPVILSALTFPSLPYKTWRNVYLRTKCWFG